MEKLRLTSARQPVFLENLHSRQETEELALAILDRAKELEEFRKKVGKPTAYPLDELPAGTQLRSISSKIYSMRSEGKLPKNFRPAKRILIDPETKEPILDKNGKVQRVVHLVCENPKKES